MNLGEMNLMDPIKIPYSALYLALINAVEHLAEAVHDNNEHLAKIANAESQWVRFTCGEDLIIIDRRDVTGVGDIKLADKKFVKIVTLRVGGYYVVDGTVEEVCNKLNIPIGG